MGEAKTLWQEMGVETTLGEGLEAPGVFWVGALEEAGWGRVSRLPRTVRVWLENVLRHWDGEVVTTAHVKALASWTPGAASQEVPFVPGRVLLQDLTGVPALVDLAAMRSALVRLGGDPSRINPALRVDLVVDHSVQVDAYGRHGAFRINRAREFERNGERYHFLKWGQQSFEGFSLTPPETGIVHQVNLEHLADVVAVEVKGGRAVACFDTVIGTDSHTTMVNGLGVVGWGVGGIEAEAAMLGQPLAMTTPSVTGVRLRGRLSEGVTATDLVLTVTERLRELGVVGHFVEFTGEGLDHLSVADRATIANMAPEYGATMGFFPIDAQTLSYLRLTGRAEASIELVERYARLQGLWREPGEDDLACGVAYTQALDIDLAQVAPSLAGPRRPQDRVALGDMAQAWEALWAQAGPKGEDGQVQAPRAVSVSLEGGQETLRDGAVVVAAITSCTNTSNPGVMIAAGLVARKARALGLRARPWVKTSLAPGSRVVTDYLDKAGLSEELADLGFHTVAYGCTTCIGNTGPLPQAVSEAVEGEGLVVNAVLSGNRNFEGRISALTQGNWLASPPLVVVYALAGRVDFDPLREPVAFTEAGRAVTLKELWPTQAEVQAVMDGALDRAHFVTRYQGEQRGPDAWQAIRADASPIFAWPEASTYIHEPPYFLEMPRRAPAISPIEGARCLALLGDSVTTDHISPAGAIPDQTPAAKWLRAQGVAPRHFNTYGTRRGHDEVMARGTFANIRLRNRLASGVVGGVTTYLGPDTESLRQGELVSIFEAAAAYRAAQTPLLVIAGQDYGMGSSRDWASKGPRLLGVRTVLAQSFERIHRSNLLGMGILPLAFEEGDSAEALGLSGREVFTIPIGDDLRPGQRLEVSARGAEGHTRRFKVRCRIDTPSELEHYRHGGILHAALRRLLAA